MRFLYKYIKYFVAACLLLFTASIFSLTEQTKLWSALNINGSLFNSQKWLYLLSLETRFIDHQDYFEEGIFQGGIGYQYLPNLSIWGGYQWTSNNQISGSDYQNRLWQQALWSIFNKPTYTLTSRTRLEERKSGDSTQWSNRLRERLTLKLPNKILGKYTPVIYDEVFFTLNSTEWSNNRLIDQNRLFIGVDIPTSAKTFFEIGYLNQLRFTSPEDVMANVTYISFNIAT